MTWRSLTWICPEKEKEGELREGKATERRQDNSCVKPRRVVSKGLKPRRAKNSRPGSLEQKVPDSHYTKKEGLLREKKKTQARPISAVTAPEGVDESVERCFLRKDTNKLYLHYRQFEKRGRKEE